MHYGLYANIGIHLRVIRALRTHSTAPTKYLSESPTCIFDMPSQAIAYVLAALILTLSMSRAFRHFSPRRTISVTALESVRQLLSPKGVSRNDQLRSRALPNQRLVRAFALTNTFVSSSVHTHSKFTHQARRLISSATTRGDWRNFAQVSLDIADHHLLLVQRHLEYASLIQQITLKVVLHALFEVPLAKLDDKGISLIASGINELWGLSKTTEALPPNLLPDMNAYLRDWVPNIDNPLDYVIPTFETLWRVVAVTVAYVHTDRPAREVLECFLHAPTKAQFDQFPVDGPSMAAIVAEVMRLHPPTKRISRSLHVAPQDNSCLSRLLSTLNPPTPAIYAADVGAVQRDPAIWGPTASGFDAMRHHPDTLTNEQRRALLGFGLGNLQCIASNWAPLAVGIISAAILGQLDSYGLGLTEGGSIGGREGWTGWTVVKTDVAV